VKDELLLALFMLVCSSFGELIWLSICLITVLMRVGMTTLFRCCCCCCCCDCWMNSKLSLFGLRRAAAWCCWCCDEEMRPLLVVSMLVSFSCRSRSLSI
jgi:hypothetical protein